MGEIFSDLLRHLPQVEGVLIVSGHHTNALLTEGIIGSLHFPPNLFRGGITDGLFELKIRKEPIPELLGTRDLVSGEDINNTCRSTRVSYPIHKLLATYIDQRLGVKAEGQPT